MALIRLLRLHEVWSHHLPSCLCNNTFFCLISYIFINWSKFQRRVSRLQRERAPSNPEKLAPWCQKRSIIPWKFQIRLFAWPLFLMSNACMFNLLWIALRSRLWWLERCAKSPRVPFVRLWRPLRWRRFVLPTRWKYPLKKTYLQINTKSDPIHPTKKTPSSIFQLVRKLIILKIQELPN